MVQCWQSSAVPAESPFVRSWMNSRLQNVRLPVPYRDRPKFWIARFSVRLGNLWVSLSSELWRLSDLQKSVEAPAGGIKGTLLLLGAMVDKGSAVIAARA